MARILLDSPPSGQALSYHFTNIYSVGRTFITSVTMVFFETEGK